MKTQSFQQLNLMRKTMEAKTILVSFLAVLATLFVVSSVAAADIASGINVKVNDVTVYDGSSTNADFGIEAGQTLDVQVTFKALEYDSDVQITVTLDGHRVNVDASSAFFDVEKDRTYTRTVTLKVPNELKDDLSNDANLNVEIDGNDYSTKVTDDDDIVLRVQRQSYNVDIKSVNVDQTLKAGTSFPVEIVLKNTGYNNLDDVYVTAKIATLGVQKSAYFGDVVAVECNNDDDGIDLIGNSDSEITRSCNEDDQDTATGVLNLALPFGTKAGTYTLEVTVKNEDTTSTQNVDVVVANQFDKTVFKSGNSLWLVNPTDNVVGYRIVAESPATASDSIVFVPAGASKTVTIEPNADEYNFDVNVFTTNGELVDTVNFSGKATDSNGSDTTSGTSPIVILTVVLAIIFIVLLIVLIVLIGRKPEKSGEFGESYY